MHPVFILLFRQGENHVSHTAVGVKTSCTEVIITMTSVIPNLNWHQVMKLVLQSLVQNWA